MKTVQELAKLIKTGENEQLNETLKESPSVALEKTDQGISLLQFAAYCRNIGAVDILKEYKAEFDIYEAASIGDMETVKKEIEGNSAILNSYSVDGFTPLGLACYFGQYEIAKYLVSEGVDVNISSNNEFNVAPIHSACAISNYKIAELLLKNGADVNVTQGQGVTALHSAAHNGNTELVKLLIDNGAEINSKMENGQTPLFMATEEGFSETANFIKEHGGA